MAKSALAAIVLALAPGAPVWAAAGSAEPPFRFYSAVDGLTQSDVRDIGQDRAGYLWFTTARGLNRYDGKEFVQFTIADGLPSNSLTALHVAPDNAVWVGDARGGVTVIRAARVTEVIAPAKSSAGSKATPITDIVTVGNRILVVAEGLGILEVETTAGGRSLQPLGADGVGAKSLETYDGGLLLVADSGLYRVELAPSLTLQQIAPGVKLVHTAANGVVWTVDKQNQIRTIRDGKFAVQARVDTEDEIVALVTDSNSKVWVATSNALFNIDGTTPNALQGVGETRRYSGISEITSLFVDRENTLWLSSDSRLIRFLGGRFQHYRLKTGSDSETVWSISQDSAGRLWFGTQTKLLVRGSDESLATIGPSHGLPEGPVRDIIRSRSGNMWVAVRGKGLYQVDTDHFTAQRIAGTEDTEILDLEEAPDGAIWVATLASGIMRYEPDAARLDLFPAPEGTSVYSLAVWDEGSVWYGADEVGLVHLERAGSGAYTQQIYGREVGLNSTYFNQLKLTGKDELWVAMDEGGLYRFNSGRFFAHGSQTPLADQTIYVVEPLQNGTVVVGGEQGLYQFRPGMASMAHYSYLTGFAGVESNVHATFFDADGALWIGTVDGATRMDASLPMPRSLQPSPIIMRMEFGASGSEIVQDAELHPQHREILIEFAAVSLLKPRGIEYSYKLTGMDDDWRDSTAYQSVRYSNLPPGSYDFAARARFPGGQWSPATASRRFTVLPFFWQRAWFVVTALAVCLLGIYSIMIYRTRIIERQNQELRARVTERTRSIELARQNLQQSNESLSREMRKRQIAVQARAEVETTFRKAFENAPIGMALLDDEGAVIDANPALLRMLWPDRQSVRGKRFTDVLSDDEVKRFLELYVELNAATPDAVEEKFNCLNSSGDSLQTVVNLSAVRADNGEFLYAVLQVQDVTESLRLTDKLEYQATYDELTDLHNRRAFEAHLSKAWEMGDRGKGLSFLMYMDLDQFKVVNDTSGHAAGDQLLRHVSDLLRAAVRGDDVVCRLGGDEFGIVLWECPTEVASRIAESIRISIDELRFHWENQVYRISVSIGGLPIDPATGDTSELQQLADSACYAAKESGRNRIHMVSGEKDSARVHQGQVRWIQRIRDAMDNHRFAIYGQVIQPATPGSVEPEHIEILLRLRDPDTQRLIPPGAFLPAAERYGLSVELDQWVVKNLLDALYVHRECGAEDRSYWVNLSGESIGDKRFAQFLVDAIKHSPLPRGMVNFEITETSVIRSVAQAEKLMGELREMGCQFALDDFGSGLSSFGYLKTLPVDYLKIDGMFIREIVNDETDRIFVKSIIDIAHNLNIKTVAEFVENDEMLEVVRELGTDYVQGFGIGRPYSLAPQLPDFPAIAGSEDGLRSRAG